MGKTLNSKEIVNNYLQEKDWRTKENSNAPYSFGGLCKHITSEVSKDYWLREVYPPHIAEAYIKGDLHIHDLGSLTLYCCGYSLESIISTGVKGVPNIPTSSPAKHLDSILNQIANLVTVFQNEIAGAVALNSFDTLIAPFIKIDNLNEEEVYQAMQNFVFSVNSNSRMGAEPAFFNLTFDLTPPADLKDRYCNVGGRMVDFTYKECQKEMNLLNRVFYRIMLKGDSEGRPFAYPIPTYNIHDRFDWKNENNDLLWKMAGKYGYPYFANFLNSDMDVSDARSMCCRLRLDLKELRNKNGGLFGAGDNTGSIGVVTLNLPRIAYKAKSKRNEKFEYLLKDAFDKAVESLEVKRKFLNEHVLGTGLLPAYESYVGHIRNHFSTIGIVGMNEMCENLIEKPITSPEGKSLAVYVGDLIRGWIQEAQEKTGNLYNYEATPAESTCYRLAKKDRKEFPEIFTQGSKETPYYTNSCHIPVNGIEGINSTFRHQEDLQVQFTGGTVIHIFLGSSISSEKAKEIVKAVCENYKVPYVSLSPLNRYCKDHGYQDTDGLICPVCEKDLDLYQRITGYMRQVANFNDGKKSEFYDRVQLK